MLNEDYRYIKVSGRKMISSDKIVTTPSIQGYKITKVLGLVTELSPRTRGVGGQIWGAIQALLGGEVSAFTLEIEKARLEAIERVIENAEKLGANAIVGVDLETSEMGSAQMNIMVISATGTAVVVEKE
jgi:uncharacterized protein YbjQ (UPF0145 family)